MRHSLFILTVLLAVTAVPAGSSVAPGKGVVVELRPGVSIETVCQDYGLSLCGRRDRTRRYRVELEPGSSEVDAIDALGRDARIGLAEADDLGDPIAEPIDQWTAGFDAGKQPATYINTSVAAQVNYTLAAATQSTGAGVLVAILDTGVSSQHPHIAARLLPGWNFVTNTDSTEDLPDGIDNDGNGIVDEATGHGTMIAGLLLRYAPDAQILPVRVLNSDGNGSLWTVLAGLEYAADHGARVVNLSLSFPRRSNLLSKAIREAAGSGALVVATAGNNNSPRPRFPAGCPQTVSVGAVNVDNTRALFSNYGTTVDLVAPGVGLVSTFWDGTYAAWSGTSFSAGIVSAEAALILSRSPDLSVDDVRSVMLSTAHSVSALNPGEKSHSNQGGLLDFQAALAAVH